jgi:HAD superfamily hydrolase (TIGR01509 family)
MSTPRSNGSPFELLIFDCDGVLVDSEVIACRAVSEALHAIGFRLSADAVAERFVGVSNKDMYAALEADWGGPLPPSFAADLRRREAALFERELRKIEGVEWALARLPMAKCVASSSTPAGLRFKLRHTALDSWFSDAVFSSTMVARGKPAPDLFLYAAEQMKVSPQRCLVIEDSMPGIIAAKSAGMIAFGFAGASHCGPGHAERLTTAGADLVSCNMRELPAFVDRFELGRMGR